MNTGTAKRIKKELLDDLTIANPQLEYFNFKKENRHKKLLNNIPKKRLKTKRHDGEDYEEFKERRRRANKRRRQREKEQQI